jgi:hypothetical protein
MQSLTFLCALPVLSLLSVSVARAAPTVLRSQNFTTDPVNYSLPAGSSFRFEAAPMVRYWGLSNTVGLTVNPALTGNAGAYLATQNNDGSTVNFTERNPGQIDFSLAVSGYASLNLSIALAGLPNAEANDFIRAVVDRNGDGSYETTIFNFKGASNSPYTDATLGALTSAFATFPTIPLPLPTAADGVLRRGVPLPTAPTRGFAVGCCSPLDSPTPPGKLRASWRSSTCACSSACARLC